MESKSQRFKRVAEKRTTNAIKALRLIGNCSSKNNYDYSDEQIKKIFSAIETELKNAKAKFSISQKTKEDFRL